MDHSHNDFIIDEISTSDFEKLLVFFQNLSEQIKHRFAPHSFDLVTLQNMFGSNAHLGFIAKLKSNHQIIAYMIYKLGYLEHDKPRISNYGITLNHSNDCSLAPVIADSWQGKGLGILLFNYSLTKLKELGYNRIILWGGVQTSNLPAVNFYKKLGFNTWGTFEYYGNNNDMYFNITH